MNHMVSQTIGGLIVYFLYSFQNSQPVKLFDKSLMITLKEQAKIINSVTATQ